MAFLGDGNDPIQLHTFTIVKQFIGSYFCILVETTLNISASAIAKNEHNHMQHNAQILD